MNRRFLVQHMLLHQINTGPAGGSSGHPKGWSQAYQNSLGLARANLVPGTPMSNLRGSLDPLDPRQHNKLKKNLKRRQSDKTK